MAKPFELIITLDPEKVHDHASVKKIFEELQLLGADSYGVFVEAHSNQKGTADLQRIWKEEGQG